MSYLDNVPEVQYALITSMEVVKCSIILVSAVKEPVLAGGKCRDRVRYLYHNFILTYSIQKPEKRDIFSSKLLYQDVK